MKRPSAYTIALFIVCCLAALALLSYFFPREGVAIGSYRLHFPALTEIIGSNPIESNLIESTPIESDTIESIPIESDEIGVNRLESDSIELNPIQSKEPIPPHPSPIPPTPQPLFRFLPLALSQTDSLPVRVVYYGDSQIEGDRMTMMVRRALQARYGGGGVGLLPLHQTVGSRTVLQTLNLDGIVQASGAGPKRYLAYGPKSNRRDTAVYGPMAQVSVLNGQVAIWQAQAPKKKQAESYCNRVRVLADDSIQVQVEQGEEIAKGLYALPDSSIQVTVTLQGKGDVYGISLETDKGVTVDNIPMRGCAGTIFTGIDSALLRAYYAATRTRLIILQYGGNVVPYTTSVQQVNGYISRIRQQIRYLQALAPEADIVFVGPSDMVDKEDGETRTHPAVAQIDSRLEKLCHQEGALYFSLFKAMGGAGGMKRWHTNGWAGSDLIHFTRQGADRAGNLLADWLIEQIEAAQ